MGLSSLNVIYIYATFGMCSTLWMDHLASWGFIVVCANLAAVVFTGDEYTLANVITFMYDQNADEDSIFHDRIDINAFGMAGYSLGGGRIMRGLAALQPANAAPPTGPARCRAAVSLHSWQEGNMSPSVPLLVLVADTDTFAGPWKTNQYKRFDEASGPKLMGVAGGGGHNLGRGLHPLISKLNLRAFGNTSLSLELNLSTFEPHPRVNLGLVRGKVS